MMSGRLVILNLCSIQSLQTDEMFLAPHPIVIQGKALFLGIKDRELKYIRKIH